MGFQIDETCMAPNRAIITRNRIKEDIDILNPIKNKPGMMHYVITSRRLYLSTDPHEIQEDGMNKTKILYEVITDKRLNEELEKLNRSFNFSRNVNLEQEKFTISSDTKPTTEEKTDIIKMINELNDKINKIINGD